MLLNLFLHYLLLGCLCFGGPAAHIAYFRRFFVEQKHWLSHEDFARHLALCQFLPGPASSQLGFLIALQRGGLAGAILGFIGFTLPSAVLMYFLATSGELWQQASGLLAGLKLLAAVVVADAIWAMSKQFCVKSANRLAMILATLALLLYPAAWMQIAVLITAAAWAWFSTAKNKVEASTIPTSSVPLKLGKHARTYLLLFLVLLVLSVLLSVNGQANLFAQFYQSGSMVFGGGHVVLPLLQTQFSSVLATDEVLLGYAAAQAVPGPMFTLATYLGATLDSVSPITGAILATLGIFLPGFLLVLGLSGLWVALSEHVRLRQVIAMVNAVAVGFLLAAWLGMIVPAMPGDWLSICIAVLGFIALRWARLPILVLILVCGGYGYLWL
ncbi:chromate efflux transporter [Spongiibacter sp. KMU-158]|uniref:Chromate efflux transporter n=1 Tax=Spongiibacter pelagi TaxID=2760804 RepID=A0A927C4U6_9GAMM|nr:chromate efflux transporter [Spongiibacter pelagi]MBD2859776.1 chromate efflux transporter [Spongiibacter pelagi]